MFSIRSCPVYNKHITELYIRDGLCQCCPWMERRHLNLGKHPSVLQSIPVVQPRGSTQKIIFSVCTHPMQITDISFHGYSQTSLYGGWKAESSLWGEVYFPSPDSSPAWRNFAFANVSNSLHRHLLRFIIIIILTHLHKWVSAITAIHFKRLSCAVMEINLSIDSGYNSVHSTFLPTLFVCPALRDK